MGLCCSQQDPLESDQMGICASTPVDEQDEMTASQGSPPEAAPKRHQIIHVIDSDQEAQFEKRLSAACPPQGTMIRAAVQLMKRLHSARGTIELRNSQGQPAPEPLTSPSNTEAAAKFARTLSREADILAGMELLDQRLSNHDMAAEHMVDDGNCQFRALAHQMYGSQNLHWEVRMFVMDHIREHADEYQLYCDEDINSYAARMSMDKTWGDEVTLKAAVDAFGVTAHIVTSNDENWHLVYTPEENHSQRKPDPIGETARKKLFLAYISPVHYNSIVARAPAPAPAP